MNFRQWRQNSNDYTLYLRAFCQFDREQEIETLMGELWEIAYDYGYNIGYDEGLETDE